MKPEGHDGGHVHARQAMRALYLFADSGVLIARARLDTAKAVSRTEAAAMYAIMELAFKRAGEAADAHPSDQPGKLPRA